MIKITCDRCKKEIDWRTHPCFRFAYNPFNMGCGSNSNSQDEFIYSKVESVMVTEKEGTRMVDLCPVCKTLVYEFIFNPESVTTKSEDGNTSDSRSKQTA